MSSGRRSIAFYGKGGGGKSSIAAALSAHFGSRGVSTLHIGCDPKSDSSRLLVPQGRVRTVIGEVAASPQVDRHSVLMQGRHGIVCLEAGGPEPGVGCAGRGITRTFELLDEWGVSLDDFETVVFDVLGDVVCGGFAAPLRSGYAQLVVIVVSGTSMSLFAANNIARAVRRFHRNGVRLAGLVANYHTGQAYQGRVTAFAEQLGSRVLAEFPHDPIFQEAEEHRSNVWDYAPDSAPAARVAELAAALEQIGELPAPTPVSDEEFEEFLARHPVSRSRG